MIKTKIIATLGPATSSEAVLRKMIRSGLDVVRLNFSHGAHSDHQKRIDLIRCLNMKMRRSIKIMADLEGFRIRIGYLREPLVLRKGERYVLTRRKEGHAGREIPFDYEGPMKIIKKGTRIYVDDGRILLQAGTGTEDGLNVKILVGGSLHSRKGVNMPDILFDFKALTSKDRADIAFAVSNGVDAIAQSFVRNAEDIRAVRDCVNTESRPCQVVAKVENRSAIENIDEIIIESDMIMVARGDMGISIPIYQVPMIQKKIIRQCRIAGKPVIVATQMLESMIEETMPTRAEVSDVANAILDGATHLMLSAETAVGRHPHRVVDMMNKIIDYTERHPHFQST